jgi:hypothetical protein
MVIGKIPGYNSAINGNSNINYENRLLNNLTVTHFTPVGYSIDFGGAGSIYRIGKDLKPSNSLNNSGILNESGFLSSLNINAVSTYSALSQWKDMQLGIGLKDPNIIESFKIIATNDSTIMETLSNQYRDNYLEDLASKFTNNSVLSAVSTGFTKAMPSLDTSAALGILSTLNGVKSDALPSGVVQQTASVLFGKMIGIQSSFPKIWDRSNYNNTSSLTIKLVSPSGHPKDVMKYVIEPLRYLILAASPVTFDGITYGFPPLWNVEAKGMISMKLAGISALSISRGGPDTVFNKDNQPTNIDVRMVVEPVVAGFASPMSTTINNEINPDGYTHMIVQNPNSIINPMSNDSLQDSSIQLKTLVLN